MTQRETYFSEHREPLEHAFAAALNHAIVIETSEPLLACAKHMRAQHYKAAERPASIDQAIRAAASVASTPEPGDEAGWVADSWLAADKGVCTVIASSLLKSSGAESAASKLAFMRTLGKAEDRREVIALLLAQDDALLESLADAVAGAAEKLAASSSSETSTAEQLSTKFSEESFEMIFDGTESFFAGLEGKLGPPNPRLREAMEREHVSSADSADDFETTNYRVKTTSRLEWWYVVDPKGEKARHERREHEAGAERFPIETRGIKAGHERKQVGEPLATFDKQRRRVNQTLQQRGEGEVLIEEVIAARLTRARSS